jgi:hypothetical protein
LWKASQEKAKVAEREELEAQRRVDELEQQSKKWVGGKRQEEEEEEEEEEERVKTPSWRRRAGQNAQLKEEEEEEEEEEKEEKLRKQTQSIINNLTPKQREQFQKLINSTPEHVRQEGYRSTLVWWSRNHDCCRRRALPLVCSPKR